MNSSFKIDKPCPKSWDSMEENFEGKFCKSCNKNVWDLTKKNDIEISEIVKSNPNLCAKLSTSKLNFAASLVLTASLTLVSCSSSKNFVNNKNSEISINQNIIFKGNLRTKDGAIVKNISVELVTLDKLFSTTSDEHGNFLMEIPLLKIKNKNIIIFSSKNISNSKVFRDTLSQRLILEKSDLFLNKTLTVNEGTFNIGAVVIISPKSPDFYYLDGKKLSERKFKEIKKNNPTYRELVFDEDNFTDILTKKSYVESVYLLYSK